MIRNNSKAMITKNGNRIRCWFCLAISLVAFNADAEVNVIWNFNEGTRTMTGGRYNSFEREPSTATANIVSDPRRGESGSAMRVEYANLGTYCGVWFHLYDSDAAETNRTYIDMTKTPYLSFWIKGELGGENAEVRMADPAWAMKEDTVSAGLVSNYLSDGITTNWQEVVVPYADFRLADKRGAVFTLLFPDSESGTVFVDDLSFKSSAQEAVPGSENTP